LEDIKIILKEKAIEVNEKLRDIMNIKEKVISDTLLEAMNYTLFSGGKRIRPILTILTAELIGANVEEAKKAGIAIELIHTYSLIHDDLPAMDNDDFRRGKLSNHKIFGDGIAILTGDALLTYAFEILSELKLEPQKVLKIITLVSCDSGFNGMVGGQVLDLEGEGKNISFNELKKIHGAKTGALFRTSILLGVYCGNYTESEFLALSNYAKYLGLCFQIVDDILDLTGDAKKLGKKVGRDSELNKATYPAFMGLENARLEAQKVADKAKSYLQIFGDKAQTLKNLLDFIIARQN